MMRPGIRQRGLALAEWTLAALLGVFMLAAAMAWLQSSLQMARSQRLPLQMAAEAVWLLKRLELAALLAGQGGLQPLGEGDARLQDWRVSDGSGPGSPASDQLVLRRVLAADSLDCEGRRLTAGSELVERYFLRADSAASGLVLACDAGSCDTGGCHDLGDAGAALLSEVDSLQLLYGIGGADAQAPPRYVDASVLRTMTAPAMLRSLRVGLLLRSRELRHRDGRWAVPADWPGPAVQPAPDHHARAIWQMTMAVPHG